MKEFAEDLGRFQSDLQSHHIVCFTYPNAMLMPLLILI